MRTERAAAFLQVALRAVVPGAVAPGAAAFRAAARSAVAQHYRRDDPFNWGMNWPLMKC